MCKPTIVLQKLQIVKNFVHKISIIGIVLGQSKKRLLIIVDAKLIGVKPSVEPNLEVCPEGSLGHH